jgi:flagellar biosynthesis regulator FlaF
MNKRDLARVKMFDAVLLYFKANTLTVDSLPAFKAAVTRFRDKVAALKHEAESKKIITSGITDNKERQRKDLCRSMAMLAGSAFSYAAEAGKEELQAEMKYTERSLLRLTETNLVLVCRRVLSLVPAYMAQLADYGVTLPQVNMLTEAVSTYESAIPATRSAISNRAQAGDETARLLSEADKIMRNSIDKLVLQFESTKPDFYAGFKRHRIIVDPTGPVARRTDTGTTA